MPLTNIPTKTTSLTEENIEAITQIEQLKRLLKLRRFSKDKQTKEHTQLDRVTYIRIAIDLGRQADYCDRRLIRIGHEFNRGFHQSMAPAQAHELIEYELNREPFKLATIDWLDMLNVTVAEYIIITKQTSKESNELFD